VFVVDAKGRYWVRFFVNRVASTPERPHGTEVFTDTARPGRRPADRI
jgi:hypothetical protein